MRRLSLWKAVDGGRSFKAISNALALVGIAIVKSSEKSEFEGRYDAFVSDENAARAEALLFVEVDGFTVQALDDLRDITK